MPPNIASPRSRVPRRSSLETCVAGIRRGKHQVASEGVPMRQNKTKAKLLAGDRSVGTFVFEFNTSGIARLAAEAGADFVVYDMEHTGWSVETIRRLIATTPRDAIMPFVRIPASDYHFVARVLDMGAMGVMVPMVESVQQAEKLVQSAKYPPAGGRGAAFTIAHDDYTAGNVAEKMQTANDQTLLIAQIETARGLEQVEQIAAVPGIDVLWIGQFDLSTSLGIPGQFDDPKFVSAMDRVVAAAQKEHKAAGYMVLDVDDAAARVDQGFRCISYQGDLWLYQAALRDGLAAVNQLKGSASASD